MIGKPNLEERIRHFAARLKRNFSDEMASDPANFKDRTVRLLRRELPPHPGHPKNPKWDAAYRLLTQGKKVRTILGILYPDFERREWYERLLLERDLRKGLARRRAQERAQKRITTKPAARQPRDGAS